MNPYSNPPPRISALGQRVLIGSLTAGVLINILLRLGIVSL